MLTVLSLLRTRCWTDESLVSRPYEQKYILTLKAHLPCKYTSFQTGTNYFNLNFAYLLLRLIVVTVNICHLQNKLSHAHEFVNTELGPLSSNSLEHQG
jgi:hypothetical protein